MSKKKNRTYMNEKWVELPVDVDVSTAQDPVTNITFTSIDNPKVKAAKVKRLVNKLVKRLWPIIEQAAKDSLKEYLKKELQDKLK